MSDINESLIKSLSDEKQVAKFLKNIENIDRSIATMMARFSNAKMPNKDDIDKTFKSVNTGLDSVDTKLKDIEAGSLQDFSNTLSGIGNRFNELVTTSMVHVSQAIENPKRMIDDLLDKVPFGLGLIAKMMMDLKYNEEEVNKIGRQSVLVFQGIDNLSANQVSTVGNGLAERWRGLAARNIASVEEFSTSFRMLAAEGVNLSTALAPADVGIKGFGDTLGEVAVALDKTFNLGSGTAAKAIGEIAKSGPGGALDAAKQIMEIGEAARSAGTSMGFLLTQSQNAATSLRMQSSNTADLARAYAAMEQIASKSMGMDAKGNNPFSQSVAAQGLNEMTSFALNEGPIKGLVAPELVKRISGLDKDAFNKLLEKRGISTDELQLQALHNLPMFLHDRMGLDINEPGIKERLGKQAPMQALIAHEIARSMAHKDYAHTQGIEQANGLGKTLTMLLQSLQIEADRTGKSINLEPVEQLFNKVNKDTADKSPLSENTFATAAKEIQEALRQGMMALTSLLGGIFRGVYMLGDLLANWTMSGPSADSRSAYRTLFDQTSKDVLGHLQNAFSLGKGAASNVLDGMASGFKHDGKWRMAPTKDEIAAHEAEEAKSKGVTTHVHNQSLKADEQKTLNDWTGHHGSNTFEADGHYFKIETSHKIIKVGNKYQPGFHPATMG